MGQEHSEHLAASIVEFSRFLRSNGFSAGMRQTVTALEAAEAIEVSDWRLFTLALKSALCSTPEEWERFPQLFQAFWAEQQPRPRSASGEYKAPSRRDAEGQEGASVFLDRSGGQAATSDRNAKAIYGASAQQRLKKVDFSQLPCVDLRRSIRRNINHGGDPIKLAYKGKKPKKNKLVILLDISGSMNFYSLFLVRFAYALQASFKRVHTFLFSTSVVDITGLLRTRHLPEALRRLSQQAMGWSGGTRIGGSLQQFNQLYGK